MGCCFDLHRSATSAFPRMGPCQEEAAVAAPGDKQTTLSVAMAMAATERWPRARRMPHPTERMWLVSVLVSVPRVTPPFSQHQARQTKGAESVEN